jgi:hypothetical protein
MKGDQAMRIYFGTVIENTSRFTNIKHIYATVTGQMSDGTLVYTEIQSRPDGSVIIEDGEPKLILDNQYTRHLKRGMQTFERI